MPPKALISVVVIVQNTPAEELRRALDSVAQQTLDQHYLSIQVVDDASDAPATTTFLDKLATLKRYKGARISVSRSPQRQGVGNCRLQGAQSATSDYILFLNAEDFIAPEYLKKALLLLEANPHASWVYPGIQTFGQSHTTELAGPFNAIQTLSRFNHDIANVYRTEHWLQAGQRQFPVAQGYSSYGYWDTLIGLMAHGHFGLPLEDGLHHLQTAHVTRVSRPIKIHLLSMYLTLRTNLLRAPLVLRSKRNRKRWRRRGEGRPSKLNPFWIFAVIQARLFRRTFGVPNAYTALSARQLLATLLWPQRFIAEFLDDQKTITLAEIHTSFRTKPAAMTRTHSRLTEKSDGPTLLVVHTWWTLGGSENVLFDWMSAARQAGYTRVVDVTERKDPDADNTDQCDIEMAFAQFSDEQFCLARMGETPLERIQVAWELLLAERPDLVFISGSPVFYLLSPYIKRYLPETTVVDILHNEWNHKDWFNVSVEYQQYLDQRIVISPFWRDVLCKRYQADPERVVIHRNQIDTGRFIPALRKESYRRSQGLHSDTRVIGFIGRLVPQKNPRVFLELAKLYLGDERFHFQVIGSGEELEPLRQAYPLPNVTFFGASLEVHELLRGMDLLVFTSNFEGFPLASLEAAASNVPVIAPDITGFREQIEQGEFGLLYTPSGRDTQDARQIMAIIDNRWDELMAAGQHGRNYIMGSHCKISCTPAQVNFLRQCNGTALEQPDRPGARKKLYLHIGITKTGSSSIQHFLHHNRATLAKEGLYYPEALTHGYAQHVLAHFFNQRHSQKTDFISDYYKTREQWEAGVRRELDTLLNSAFPEIVLSSEAFRLATPQLVAEYLSAFDVTVIVFLRRQDNWLESAFNQNSKMRTPKNDSIDHLKKRARWMIDYPQFLLPWEQAFGRENIVVVPFEKASFSDGLETSFLHLLGRDLGECKLLPGEVNARLSRDATAYLQRRRESDPLSTSSTYELIEALEAYTRKHPDPAQYRYTTSPAQRRDLIEEFDAGNREVSARYLQDGRETLFEEPGPALDQPWAEYSGLSEESLAAIERFLEEHATNRRRNAG